MNNKISILLILLGNCMLGFAQTGKIDGRMNLRDLENKNIVIETTFVILKSKTISDSAKLDKDLSFKFENLPSDTFLVSFSRRSYPYSGEYIFYLKDGETRKLDVPYSSTCPFDKIKDGICPVCKKTDEVIPIRYGLITTKIGKDKKPSKRKYKSGGCMISDCQASWFCERDQKEF